MKIHFDFFSGGCDLKHTLQPDFIAELLLRLPYKGGALGLAHFNAARSNGEEWRTCTREWGWRQHYDSDFEGFCARE
jgi:hypothetical protein